MDINKLQKWVKWMLISVGVLYIWFGVMKFIPNMSPAECLAEGTISIMTMGWISGRVACYLLATVEVVIGLILVLRPRTKVVLVGMLLHMGGTMTPLFLSPELVYGDAIGSLTLTGQYIFKNIVLIAVVLFALQVQKEAELCYS